MKILILGGGFGGVKAALELENTPGFDVTLLSDHPDFRFYPALYLTATGKRKSASSIPLKEIFNGKGVRLVNAAAKKLDLQKKTVTAGGKEYGFDKLIVALGSVTNFFGIKGLKEYAFGIKTLDEAEILRKHIHKQILSSGSGDNYVVIGGGPTGVELAGALPGYIKHVMEAHGISGTEPHVDLVEAAPRLVPRLPRGYSKAIAKHLRKLGVQLFLNESVQAETANKLMVSGHSIDSHCVIWTAGVTNNPFLKENGFALNPHGKASVDSYLQSVPDVYVIGDNADTKYSGMAQTALHDAIFVVSNLKRQAAGKKLKRYKAEKPVYITPAGPHWSAVLWGGWRFYGLAGWFLRDAADFVAYHKLEPFWKAAEHWQAEHRQEITCEVCGH